MDKALGAAALAGTLGAAGLAALQTGAYAAGIDEQPMSTQFGIKVLGLDEKKANLVGGALFLIAGAAWGALYTATTSSRTPKSGALFSILPSLFVMLALYPLLGKPRFAGGQLKGLTLPFLLNALWGAFVGARTSN